MPPLRPPHPPGQRPEFLCLPAAKSRPGYPAAGSDRIFPKAPVLRRGLFLFLSCQQGSVGCRVIAVLQQRLARRFQLQKAGVTALDQPPHRGRAGASRAARSALPALPGIPRSSGSHLPLQQASTASPPWLRWACTSRDRIFCAHQGHVHAEHQTQRMCRRLEAGVQPAQRPPLRVDIRHHPPGAVPAPVSRDQGLPTPRAWAFSAWCCKKVLPCQHSWALSRPIREECPPASRIKLTSRIRPALQMIRIKPGRSLPILQREAGQAMGVQLRQVSGNGQHLPGADRCSAVAPAHQLDLRAGPVLEPFQQDHIRLREQTCQHIQDPGQTSGAPHRTWYPKTPPFPQRPPQNSGCCRCRAHPLQTRGRRAWYTATCSPSAVSAGMTFSQYVVLPEFFTPEIAKQSRCFHHSITTSTLCPGSRGGLPADRSSIQLHPCILESTPEA